MDKLKVGDKVRDIQTDHVGVVCSIRQGPYPYYQWSIAWQGPSHEQQVMFNSYSRFKDKHQYLQKVYEIEGFEV